MGGQALRRAHWLGHRWHRHGLSGLPDGDDRLADLLLLGVQEARRDGAAHALAARTGEPPEVTTQGPLVLGWTVRGAPHVHPANLLDAVRDAHEPRDTDDGGAEYVAAVLAVAGALGDVVTGPTGKGDASTAVTKALPELATWCPQCEADHVPDGTFRAAGRQAQLILDPDERGTVLLPRPRTRQRRVAHPRGELLHAFARANGTLTRALYRDWTGTTTATVAALWDELGDVVRVDVDGTRADLPEALLAEVRDAPPAEGVALVPPHDPYLRQADPALLMPDRARRAELRKAVSPPGALLVDGEVAGTWRIRKDEVAVSPFGTLPPRRRREAEDRAAAIAPGTTVSWPG